jgi:hypothetical protein
VVSRIEVTNSNEKNFGQIGKKEVNDNDDHDGVDDGFYIYPPVVVDWLCGSSPGLPTAIQTIWTGENHSHSAGNP